MAGKAENSSMNYFVTVSCFRKPKKARDAITNYGKNLGKFSQAAIINLKTVHDGDDGSSLVIIDAILSFKGFINSSKIVKNNNLTILAKRSLPLNLSFETLTSFNPTALSSDFLDTIKSDLDSAIRLFRIGKCFKTVYFF